MFLSAHPVNIKVFRAIADHPKFRRQITEIIWDDARFVSEPPFYEEMHPLMENEDMEINPAEECPNWFVEECEENVRFMRQRKKREVERPDHRSRQSQGRSAAAAESLLGILFQNIERAEPGGKVSKR